MASKKLKTCRVCKKKFIPFQTTQAVCGWQCALEYARLKEKKRYKDKTNKMTREYYANDRKHNMKLAVTACHRYIRERDKDQGCISCGTFKGKMNAGHYLSAGRMPELKFHWANINKQCEYCNNSLSGNASRYRVILVKKVGLAMVEWLEGSHEMQNRTLDDLKGVKWWFDQKFDSLNCDLSND